MTGLKMNLKVLKPRGHGASERNDTPISARFWFEATARGSRLALLLLCQLGLLIAFVPANNHLVSRVATLFTVGGAGQ